MTETREDKKVFLMSSNNNLTKGTRNERKKNKMARTKKGKDREKEIKKENRVNDIDIAEKRDKFYVE